MVGIPFVHTSIDRVELRCLRSGVVYALTPSEHRRGAASQEEALRQLGFEKVDMPEFQLYGKNAIDIVTVYQKRLKEGEALSIGKWVVMAGPPGMAISRPQATPWQENDGELLYNGIRLPRIWPPRHLDSATRDVQPVPYLDHPPEVIPIDVGRQLFVDDFLIEKTTLRRQFHQPVKHVGNPVLKPETELELNKGYCPAASPFSDGCFYDPKDKLFKLWYHAGWMDGVALALSDDGIHWRRPKLDVVSGTNRVVAQRDEFRRDGVSVWLAHNTKRLDERFKMLFANVNAPEGELRAEALDLDGTPIEPFTLQNCRPLSCDTTLHQITWQDGDDLSALSGKPIRLRFRLTNGKLFAFWISPDRSGASHGYVAAGGPGFTGPTDTRGSFAYPGKND
jgi:hypothetical protein